MADFITVPVIVDAKNGEYMQEVFLTICFALLGWLLLMVVPFYILSHFTKQSWEIVKEPFYWGVVLGCYAAVSIAFAGIVLLYNLLSKSEWWKKTAELIMYLGAFVGVVIVCAGIFAPLFTTVMSPDFKTSFLWSLKYGVVVMLTGISLPLGAIVLIGMIVKFYQGT